MQSPKSLICIQTSQYKLVALTEGVVCGDLEEFHICDTTSSGHAHFFSALTDSETIQPSFS